MEHLLAHHVVRLTAKVQLPATSVHEVYLPSRQGRWLINRVYMFTSHGEDVHLRVGPLAIPISRGPNEL